MKTHNRDLDLSIIVPVYNEEETVQRVIRTTFQDAYAHLKRKFEVIVVDDGSTDATRMMVKSLAPRYENLIIITHKRNQGLGRALLSGIKQATYDIVTFIPGDGQIFLRDIVSILPYMKNYDLIITYRQHTRDYTTYRRIASKTFKFLMGTLFNLPIKDYL